METKLKLIDNRFVTLKSFTQNYAPIFYNWYESNKYPMYFRCLDGFYMQEAFQQLPMLMASSIFIVIFDEKVIGAVNVHDWNRTAGVCSIGIILDEKYQDKSLCGLIIKEIGAYLIKHRNIQKLNFEFSKEDEKIVHLVEREKFKKEGEFEREAFINGKYVDVLRYAFFAERIGEYE